MYTHVHKYTHVHIYRNTHAFRIGIHSCVYVYIQASCMYTTCMPKYNTRKIKWKNDSDIHSCMQMCTCVCIIYMCMYNTYTFAYMSMRDTYTFARTNEDFGQNKKEKMLRMSYSEHLFLFVFPEIFICAPT